MSDPGVWLQGPALALRVALGLLFLRAGSGKMRDPAAFAELVRAYALLPDRLAGAAARALIAAELVLGAWLLSGAAAPLAALAAGLLLLLFVLAMVIGLRRGQAGIACGCLGGDATGRLSWRGVAATAGLLPLSALAALPWQGGGLLAPLQPVLAGLLLFALHDAAGRLADLPPAGQRA